MDISHQTKFKSIWPLYIYHVIMFGKIMKLNHKGLVTPGLQINNLSANLESLTPCDI